MNRADYELAQNPNTSSEELAHLVRHSSDMSTLVLIAQHPNTPDFLLRELWQHPHIQAVREEVHANPHPGDIARYVDSDESLLYNFDVAMVRHPNLPEAILAEFASQPRFGALVARHPNTSTEILGAMVRSGIHYGETLKAIGRHPNTPSDALNLLACRISASELDTLKNHPNLSPLAREIIAYRQENRDDVSPEALSMLATHGTVDIMNRMLQNPTTPTPILNQLFPRLGSNFYLFIQLAQHSTTPPSTLLAVADKFVLWYQKQRVALKLDASPTLGDSMKTIYTSLAAHADHFPDLRAALDRLGEPLPLFEMSQRKKLELAANPATPSELLSLLILDLSEAVLCALAQNPSVPLAMLETLMVYRSAPLEDAIVRNPQASGEMLRELYKRRHPRFILERRYDLIAAHPNTPQDILAYLAKYKDAKIQNALARNPNFRRE